MSMPGTAQLAAVLFYESKIHWAQRWMMPGFRHVELAIKRDGRWVGISGKSGGFILATPLPASWDPEEHARLMDATCLTFAPLEPEPRRCVVGLWTCVSIAKAALGLRCWAITPWQLYRWLVRKAQP